LIQTGHELRDVGRSLSWDALGAFVQYLSEDSATVRDAEPELAAWGQRSKTNALLADIYDLLAIINTNLIAMATRKKQKTPKRYPRPGDEGRNEEKHIGSGAMPAADLHKWFEEKRRERWQKSQEHM